MKKLKLLRFFEMKHNVVSTSLGGLIFRIANVGVFGNELFVLPPFQNNEIIF